MKFKKRNAKITNTETSPKLNIILIFGTEILIGK